MITFRKSLTLAMLVIATSQVHAILPTPTDNSTSNNTNNNTGNNKVIFKQYSEINNQINNQVHNQINNRLDNQVVPVNTNKPQVNNQVVAVNTSNPQAQPVTTSDSQYADLYAQSHHINKTIQAFVVKMVEGQEQLIPVDSSTKIHTGDIVEYQGQFTNNGTDRIRSMMVALSIPKEMELTGNIYPQFALGSNDARNFSHMPLRANIDGTIQDLPFSYYRALKWQIENLEMGKKAIVTYRAKMK